MPSTGQIFDKDFFNDDIQTLKSNQDDFFNTDISPTNFNMQNQRFA